MMSSDLIWGIIGLITCFIVYWIKGQCEKIVKNPDYCVTNYGYRETDNKGIFEKYIYVPVGFKVYYILLIALGFLPIIGFIYGCVMFIFILSELNGKNCDGFSKVRFIENSFMDKVKKFFNSDISSFKIKLKD